VQFSPNFSPVYGIANVGVYSTICVLSLQLVSVLFVVEVPKISYCFFFVFFHLFVYFF